MSSLLLDRKRLVAVDHDPIYVAKLRDRWVGRSNVRTLEADLTDPDVAALWKDEKLDTIFCSNVLEHLECDEQVLRTFHDSLLPGGHCVIVVPAGRNLYTPLDSALGHYRRYTVDELRRKMETVGLEMVCSKRFAKAAALGWWVAGRVLRRRHITPFQMILFDKLWPICKLLDFCLLNGGMSLLMVGRKCG